jgi:hypothetical protein
LLPGRIWTELECAQAVVQAQKSANGAIHEANDGECTAVLDMHSVAADPAGLQRSCFIYSAATPTNQICTVAPSACDAAEHGTPFEGADLTLPGRALGGSIPTNTTGGMLTWGNAHVIVLPEAVRQVRGDAGVNQVAGAKLALAHGIGGPMSLAVTMILGR